MRKALFGIVTLILFGAALCAADASGKWTAQVPGRSGQMRDVTFVLKASGSNLTGTMSRQPETAKCRSPTGKSAATIFLFSVTQEFGGNSFTQKYTGKVVGSEIQIQAGRWPGTADRVRCQSGQGI